MSYGRSTPPRKNIDRYPTEADAAVPEGFKRVVPIVMAANEAYSVFGGVTIESIKQHMSPDSFYRIYFFHSGISQKRADMLERMGNEQLVVRCIDVSNEVGRVFPMITTPDYLTEETYYRFLIPLLLPFFERIIYLDCDTVVLDDIVGIIPEDMGDNLIAAAKNPHPKKLGSLIQSITGIKDLDGYINAGVLVINMPQWLKENAAERCAGLVDTAVQKRFPFADQDVLNIVCAGRIHYLSPKWNYMWHYEYSDEESLELYQDAIAEVGEGFSVLHHTTGKKPWNSPFLPRAKHFWKYAADSPFFYDVISETTAKAERDLDTAGQFLESARRDIEAIRASHSYRLGSLILFIPQKLKALIKRIAVKDKPAK